MNAISRRSSNRPAITIGERVAYSAAWLRSLRLHAGREATIHGTATGSEPFGDGRLITIRWDDGIVGSVLDANLTLVDRLNIDSIIDGDRIAVTAIL